MRLSRQLLYFCIGLFGAWLIIVPFSYAGPANWGTRCTVAEAQALVLSHYSNPGNYVFYYKDPDVNGVALVLFYSPGYTISYVLAYASGFVKFPGNPDGCAFLNCSSCTYLNDEDGDGITSEYDLKPDSSESYKAAIISVCYDANNKIVAGVIQDGEGNQYSFGTMPSNMEGHTIKSLSTDNLQNLAWQTGEDLAASLQKLDIANLNITKRSSGIEVNDDGTIIPGNFDPLGDYNQKEKDQTTARTPTTQEAPTKTSTEGDTDSTHLKNIVDNTDATNKNLKNIQGFLGITNDYLAQIEKDLASPSAVSSPKSSFQVTTGYPSADEIGQAVGDNLIDSGQTIDPTITDNIEALDETDTLTTIKTKYSDRYDLFIDTLKDSDLFTLPFSIFTGPSGSGSSVQTVEIGSWGSSSTQTATIDFSQYDNVWNILSGILLMLTSFACFKIIVLKKG